MPTPRPRAVLFDLDGTLIDSIQLILQAARHAFASNECEWPSDERWKAGIGTPLRTMFAEFADDRVGTDDFVAAYREYQHANHDRLVACYDDIVATVTTLKDRGHALGVVTSKSDDLARRGLAHVGLIEHFETVVGCDSCERHKPHPEPVLTALDRLGYAPHEAVFVGDSIHDIEAGNAAGVLTVAALWGPFPRSHLERSRPDHFAERVTDLVGLIQAAPAGPPR